MALRLSALRIAKGDFSLSADMTVSNGDLVAIIGPSGAGKSTLFDAIAGFLEPREGAVELNGNRFGNTAPGKRPIAMLFQDNNLFPYLNVGQNVGLALTHKSRLSPTQKAEVAKVLERVGLAGMADRRLSQLSGGQVSRVALARLLLQDKPLWLLDEPFSALGPSLKREMLELVKEIATESASTVLMITHDPSDARALAKHCILVADGKATGPFETKAFLENPPPALSNYLG